MFLMEIITPRLCPIIIILTTITITDTTTHR